MRLKRAQTRLRCRGRYPPRRPATRVQQAYRPRSRLVPLWPHPRPRRLLFPRREASVAVCCLLSCTLGLALPVFFPRRFRGFFSPWAASARRGRLLGDERRWNARCRGSPPPPWHRTRRRATGRPLSRLSQISAIAAPAIKTPAARAPPPTTAAAGAPPGRRHFRASGAHQCQRHWQRGQSNEGRGHQA